MSSVGCAEETKFIYYIDEEETPYLVKLNIAPESVTLGDFKNALNKPHAKFFFKSIDDDFGVVKEEIFDDSAVLPCFNGRVVSWLVTAEGSGVSDPVNAPDSNEDVNFRAKIALMGADPGSPAVHLDGGINTSSAQHNHTTAAPADSTSTTLNANGNPIRTCDPDSESVHSANQDRIAPLRSFHNYKAGNRHHFTAGNNYYGQPGSAGGIRHRHHRVYGPVGSGTYETPSSMLSSDLESTSFFDSEDESSRFSSVTGTTMSSRRYGRVRQRRRRRRPPPISRASSFSSITDSTMSLNIVAVTLNMDTVNFLGISIVGQSNKAGDGGIYVGSIMKGGAVAQDGRIEPGDMILEVNGISFEEMSNDDAVRILREQVQRPGPITLVVAKCWDPNPRGGYFTIPRQEPVRPIDPRAWVLHTNAMTAPDGMTAGTDPQILMNGTGASSGGESSSTLSPSGAAGLTPGMSMGTLTSGQTSMPLGTSAAAYNMAALLAASRQQQKQQQEQHQHMLQQQQHQITLPHPSFYPVPNVMMSHGYPQQVTPSIVTASSSLPEIERYSEPIPLTVNTDIATVISAMVQPDSGLEIRDRIWLKLTVPNAFIGSDLVDWLYRHLDGFADRRSARKYAANLLKLGFIRHTVNKATFSEQCYYVFRDLTGHMSCLSLEEVDSVSEVGALPPPNWGHNTTSTNLTVGLTLNQKSNPGQLSEFIAPTSTSATALNNGSAAAGLIEGGGSSQYSSVPPLYHPPLAAPIRQLIADGQDATAAAAAAVGCKVTQSRTVTNNQRDNVSGYSSSSSSTDSDVNHFKHEKQRTAQANSDLASANHSDPNYNHNHLDAATHLRQQSRSQLQSANPPPFGMHPIRPRADQPTAPGTMAQKPKDITASSTASSSTSEGNHVDPNSKNLAIQGDCNRARGMGTKDHGQDSVISSKSSSSSSSCGPINSGQLGADSRVATSKLTTSQQSQQQFNASRFLLGHQSNLPPPPPPRISTAASGFTLTNRP
ncbi:unnamed protein product [Calicophoron daubneyi]|uniref:Dishevelled n=1 Tax=Calicophoron daubneyi TaxID=300641 RepID=A0AAV2TAM8_CALDB